MGNIEVKIVGYYVSVETKNLYLTLFLNFQISILYLQS